MAGTYVKKDFGLSPEEQTLLKDSNGTRIVPTKGAEPVRLSPGWEGTGRTEDELNFKGVTMDQADMELNPPRDRWNIVFLIMILHGIGALMPWNMFITASDYFSYKFSEKYTGIPDLPYAGNFLASLGLVAQFPNVLFNWINIFLPLGGNLTNRIAWGIFTQVIIFVFTVIMAMLDTSTYPGVFYYVTLISIFILNTSLGIYQNSVFGMAAKLPGKYTGGVVLGANISGTFSTVIRFLALYFSPNERTSAIYYFITALFVLLACFDTYFALPINRYFRYHEYLHEKDAQEKLKYDATSNQKVSLWKVFKQCSLQCFNIWFIFFVTLSTFPAVQAQIKSLDANFIIEEKFYANLMCFMAFNVSAMMGSFFASLFQFPSKNLLIVPVLARAAFIPLFLMCNYAPGGMKRTNLWIEDDWVYLGIVLAMGFSSGYFSSSAMMFCSSTVEPQYASTAGMYASAFLVTGVFSGVAFSYVMPSVVTYLESMV